MDILTTIGSIKSAYETVLLLKNSADSFTEAEIKLKLADLISSLADAKMEMTKIQELLIETEKENNELKRRLHQKENLFFDRPYYVIKKIDGKDEGPFCQICYDKDNKLVRLHNSSVIGEWNCGICNCFFHDKNYNSEEEFKKTKDAIQRFSSLLP